MGSEAQIPFIDLGAAGQVLQLEDEQGTTTDDGRWKNLCAKVRVALETHGCFLLFCDKIPKKLREDMFMAMKNLFDLPEETKNKYVNPRPYRSYMGKSPIIPLHESFGIDNEPGLGAAQAFITLMWPEGNPSFCETLTSLSSRMLELNHTILKMIFDSFGTGKLYDSYIQGSTSVMRLMKYKFPLENESAAVLGLVPHTDKNTLTILTQNDVQGLEILNNDGVWVPLLLPNDAFVVIVGDELKAWSNARLKAVRHRVVMSGKKERYSFGLFSMPKEEVATQVPRELVDDDHPLAYRPFNFSEFLSYFVNNISDDALEIYAGI